MEIEEYIECLNSTEGAAITMNEIVTLALTADLNGDRRIDYEELMLFFHDILKQIRIHNLLQQNYEKFKAEGGIPMTKKKFEESK